MVPKQKQLKPPYIDSAVSNISTSVDIILKQCSTLFNRDNNVKPWNANELKFYDDKMAEAKAMRCKQEECQTNILTNITILKRKLSPVNDEIPESKRKRKQMQ